MNGSKSRALRKLSLNREQYQALKRLDAMRKRAVAQQPKPLKLRAHKAKKPIKPTWPLTDDQRMQSRPMIVVHHLRAIYPIGGRTKKQVRAMDALGRDPKHELDALARAARSER